jgi:hypothetical protein
VGVLDATEYNSFTAEGEGNTFSGSLIQKGSEDKIKI